MAAKHICIGSPTIKGRRGGGGVEGGGACLNSPRAKKKTEGWDDLSA